MAQLDNEAKPMLSTTLAQPQPRAPLSLVSPRGTVSVDQQEAFIGISQSVVELKEFVAMQARQHQPVLLIGPRGLRQEQIAQAIHQMSEHWAQPFMKVNAHGLSDESLHVLLFGKAAQGGQAPQPGMLDSCGRGTIFINELTNLPALIQQRLAAHLEEQRWRTRGHAVVGRGLPRLIFATAYDPLGMRAENRIAYGLVEFLKPHSIQLKSLRERSEDIAPLARHLLERLARHANKGEFVLTPEALRLLAEYDWEGNIDELEAVLAGSLKLTEPQQIGVELLPPRLRFATLRSIPEMGVDLPQMVDDYERTLIETALRQMAGNQTKAAQLLGLRVQTLNMKLKRFKDLGVEVKW